jgi:hypothetical protein
MENKIELLKKLGFSDSYLKFVADNSEQNETEFLQVGQFAFDVISVDTSEITYPVIEKTEAPINSYVN